MPLADVMTRNQKPRETPDQVFDLDGLFVLLKRTASRLWQFKDRIDGKERLMSIGRYREISLAMHRICPN